MSYHKKYISPAGCNRTT